jgi:hypothetical protein
MSGAGTQRWTVSDVPGGVEEDSYGSLVKYADHRAVVSNLRHERNFWSWKFSRREDECEELAERLRKAEGVTTPAPTQPVSLPEGPGFEEAVEALAEALWNEREFRDPTGDAPDDWCPPGHDVRQPPPREPFLWERMVSEGKFDSDQKETRDVARAALSAALPYLQQPQPIGVEEGLREKRTEYRVLATGSPAFSDHTSEALALPGAEHVAEQERRHYRNVRIQTRTVAETDWTDLPTQQQEGKG